MMRTHQRLCVSSRKKEHLRTFEQARRKLAGWRAGGGAAELFNGTDARRRCDKANMRLDEGLKNAHGHYGKHPVWISLLNHCITKFESKLSKA